MSESLGCDLIVGGIYSSTNENVLAPFDHPDTPMYNTLCVYQTYDMPSDQPYDHRP